MMKKTLMIIGLVILSLGMFAQSVEEAGEAYNEGNESMKAKQYAGAVTAYENALDIAKAVGGEADQLRNDIENKLINAYYRNGIAKYKSKKYDASISEFDKSYALATETDDAEMQNKITVIKAKVFSAKGLSLIKQKDLDGAYAAFEEAHKIKPGCVLSYYGKGKVWKERGDMKQMIANMDQAIENGDTEPKMEKYVKKAKIISSKALVDNAKEEINKEHGEIAVQYLNNSFKYKSATAEDYYLLSFAYNISKDFGKSIDNANKALAMTDGEKSDIYFQLGKALEGKGDASGACSAYKKVTSGDYLETAKYQVEHVLKCG